MRAEIIKKMVIAIVSSLLLTSCVSEPTIIKMEEVPENEDVASTATPLEHENTTIDEAAIAKTKNESIYIHVCGAVNKPGVYEMSADSRVFEAVEMAGGFTSEAHQQSVNMADNMVDGQQLIVPTKDEAMSGLNQIMEIPNQGNSLININKADITMLQELNGIGEAKAKEILAHRDKNGAFTSVEEIKNVNGIGEKLYERIKENITVD